jgi:hypothetical protein
VYCAHNTPTRSELRPFGMLGAAAFFATFSHRILRKNTAVFFAAAEGPRRIIVALWAAPPIEPVSLASYNPL